jgi:CBS domain-containing protein
MSDAMATRPVHEVMTAEPLTVTPDTPLGDLLVLLDHHDYNAIPVVDRAGVLCGIVTKLEVLRLVRPAPDVELRDEDRLSRTPVGDIMRRGVVTVAPGDPAVAALDLMVDTRLRSLPVAERSEGGLRLVGIVSQGDLLRALRAEYGAAR